MDDDFAVHLGGLAALNTNLNSASGRLGAALGSMRDVGVAPLGTEDLDRACGEFQRSWEHGLGKLGECVELVRTGIDASCGDYAEVERVLDEVFSRLGGSL